MKKAMCVLFVFFAWTTGFLYPGILIVTNPGTDISSLKTKDVKDIFTGKRTRWNGSGKIILATLKDPGVHREFLRRFVKKTPSQFRNFWRRKVFTGEGKNPKAFDSEAALIAFVSKTKGAVGYISSPKRKGVKIVTILDNKGGGR